MSVARARFLVLALGALAVPLLVWWQPILRTLSGSEGVVEVPSWDAIPLGGSAEAFTLTDAHGTPVQVAFRDPERPTVVYFWSAYCPCIADCEARIKAMQTRFPSARVRLFAVNPNPDDSRAEIERIRTGLEVTYPVYRDPTGRLPYRLGVGTSASVAIFDKHGKLRFRGAIDDDIYRPTTSYLERALTALLEGKPVSPDEPPSYGCPFPERD